MIWGSIPHNYRYLGPFGRISSTSGHTPKPYISPKLQDQFYELTAQGYLQNLESAWSAETLGSKSIPQRFRVSCLWFRQALQAVAENTYILVFLINVFCM